MNHELTIMLYRGSIPSPVKVCDRPKGTYATLTKSEMGYFCKVTSVKNSKRVLEQTLPENKLGGYLTTLYNLKKAGVLLRGIFLHEDHEDGLQKANGRLPEKIPYTVVRIQ